MVGDELSPAVARAVELDAEGRHDDAIQELARAAQRNDIAATTELAKRIIVGDRAPRLIREGIGLLKDAVRLGGGEAAARLAPVLVSGALGEPDWGGALRLLALAGERGSSRARDELAVLATLSGGDPQALAAGAGLGALLDPSPGRMLHEDPGIRVFPDFVNGAVCDWLVARSLSKLERALVYDVVRQADLADGSRTNSAATFQIMDADLVHLAVQTRMAAACGEPVPNMEAPTVLHYGVGETIGYHYDFVDPANPGYAEEIRRSGYRTLTFLVYLNDDYDGGETVFPKLDLSHSGRRGEGLCFVNTLRDGRADVRTLHCGMPPSRGEKWVFSQFIRNRPVVPKSL